MGIELPIDLLRTFTAVSETSSFTLAGERRHVTQAAVSMQMKRLEGLIERPLFGKNGRQIHLTPAGETLLEHAHRILAVHDKAVAAFADPDMFGRVRFGCAEEYASRFLPSVLPGFRKAYPRIQVDIQVAPGVELHKWLSKDELDLCLLERIPEDGSRTRRKSKRGPSKTPCSHCDVEGGTVVHREPVVWVTSAMPQPMNWIPCRWRSTTKDAPIGNGPRRACAP
jgi:DNA-binding transcriptional LysR family regulator